MKRNCLCVEEIRNVFLGNVKLRGSGCGCVSVNERERVNNSKYETYVDADEPHEQEVPTEEIDGKYSHWFTQLKKKDEIDDDYLVDANKDPEENKIQEGSTIMFVKKLKEILKKKKLTKADLKGATFELLKKKKYALSLSKFHATKYEQDGIEEIIPHLWSSSIEDYDRDAALGIHYWSDSRKWFYKGSIGITSNMRESDYPRLSQNEIEDMYLLKVQGKLHHLNGDFEYDLINSLFLYIRSVVIKKRVEDAQVGVESYQKKLNLMKPTFFVDDIEYKLPYTTMGTSKGVVYPNKNGQNMLMRYDKVHKFSDGTLKKVIEKLKEMIREIVLGYDNACLKGQEWTVRDDERSKMMRRKIEKISKVGRLLRRLESRVGGRPKADDIRLLVRPE
ncbi:hypothetical protein Tco_1516149 [Tanacetum coccineum]